MPKQQSSQSPTNGNGDYAKDINLLPEDLQTRTKSKPSQRPSLDFVSVKKIQAQPAKQEKFPKFGLWIKKIFNFQKKSLPQPVSKPVEKPKLPQFKASSRPSLRVNIRETKASAHQPQPSLSQPEPPLPSSSSTAPIPERSDIDIKKEDSKPPVAPKVQSSGPTPAKPKPPLPPRRTDQPAKNISFSSIKELMNEDEGLEPPASDDFDVNLIPTELITGDVKKKFFRKIIIAGVISVLLVVILYGGVSILGAGSQAEIKLIKQETDQLALELEETKNTLDQLTSFTKQVDLVSQVLADQQRWTKLFELLEQETIPEVYYHSVSISTSNQVGLSLTAKSYHDLARQYLIFQQNPNITELSFGSATLSDEVWEEYLKELETQIEQQSNAQVKNAAVNPEFKLPTYNEMQQLMTVDSDVTFVYKFSNGLKSAK